MQESDGLEFAEVLLIEDSPTFQSIVVEILAQMGIHAAVAENGEAGLRYLRSNAHPLAIILDMEMPVMNGYEFLVRRTCDPLISRIPVIICSADDLDGLNFNGLGVFSIFDKLEISRAALCAKKLIGDCYEKYFGAQNPMF